MVCRIQKVSTAEEAALNVQPERAMSGKSQKKGSFLNLAALGNASWSAGDNSRSACNLCLSISDAAAEEDDLTVETDDGEQQPYRYSAVGSTSSSSQRCSPQTVPTTATPAPPPELLTAEEAARSVISNELQWLKLRCSIERSGFVTSAGLQQMLPQLVQDRLDDMNEREAELLREQAKRMAMLNTQRTTTTEPGSPDVVDDASVSALPPKTLGVSMLSPGAKRKHRSSHHHSFSEDIRKRDSHQTKTKAKAHSSLTGVQDQRKKQLALDLKASLTPPPRPRRSVADGLLTERIAPATCVPSLRPRARLSDDTSSGNHTAATGNRSRLGSAASALASLAPGLTPQRRSDRNYPDPSPSVFGATQSGGGIDWSSAIGPPPLSSSGASFSALDMSRHDLGLGGHSGGDSNSSLRDALPPLPDIIKGELPFSGEDKGREGASLSALRLSILPTL